MMNIQSMLLNGRTWIAVGLLWLTFLESTVSQECYDTGGAEFCKYILRLKGGKCNDLKPSELSQCMKTCLVGGCINAEKNNRPPPWAIPSRRPSVTRRRESGQQDELSLPLYAVIIIVVALVVVLIGITVCVLKIRQKWKRRKSSKIARNRDLLRYAPPPSRTLPPSYLWSTGSQNGAYYVEETENWPRTMQSQPDARDGPHTGVLNNSSGRDRTGAKEINVIQNGTKKRQAPQPKEETMDQRRGNENLKVSTVSTGKGPAPLPPTKNSTNERASNNDGVVHKNISIPIERTESPYSDIYKNGQELQTTAPEGRIPNNPDPDHLQPVREITLLKEASDIGDEAYSKHAGDKEYQLDDTMTVFSEGTYSAVTDDTVSGPALVSILGEWKDHLQTQRKELAEYYKNLHAYIKHIGLKPRIDQNDGLDESNTDLWYQDKRMTEEGEEPSQANLQDAVYDLKNKLARIQTLLETPRDLDLNTRSTGSVEKNRELMRKLQERDCLKVQVRIAEALDTARKRNMTVVSSDGPIACHCKQIHNIMTDMLDPRTSTKIELGTHAASTLSSKLLTNIQCNLLPVLHDEGAKFDVSKTSDRIAMLTQQLLDMARQLVSRASSFQEKDYAVYIKALIDSCEKTMDSAFHLVCTIVDLQTEEKRRLSRNVTHSLPMTMNNDSLKLPRHLTFDNRSKNSYRNDYQSHCTSHSTLDVKRLNEDILRLRHLLDNGMKLPSLSDVTLPTNRNSNAKTAKTNLPNVPARYNRVYDDRSSISCSTCMISDAEESQFFEDDLTDLMYPDINDHHMINTDECNTIIDGEVQEVDETPSELYRPATRPRTKPNCFANVIYNEPNNLQLPIVDQQSIQAASSQPSQLRARGAQPSSFASFRTGYVATDDIQPRHQAMLGRYFNEEVVQPKENNNMDDFSNEQIDAEPVVNPQPNDENSNPNHDVNGGSQEDNPEQRLSPINLLDIPEITVYRNGAQENNPPNNNPDATQDDTTLPVNPALSQDDGEKIESSDDTGSITSAENILADYPEDITDSEKIEPDDANSILGDDESAAKLHNNLEENNEDGGSTNQEGIKQNIDERSLPLPADSSETDSIISEFEFPRAPSVTDDNVEISTQPIDANESQANTNTSE